MNDVALYLDRAMLIEGSEAVLLGNEENRSLYGVAGLIQLQNAIDVIWEIFDAEIRIPSVLGIYSSPLENAFFVLDSRIHLCNYIEEFRIVLWVVFERHVNLAIVRREVDKIALQIKNDMQR